MLFNSLEFLVFFIITTSLFFLLKHQYRWLLLLLASSYFYMVFKPIYILILAFTIVIDYFAGIAIEKQEKQHNKKLLLILSLVANLGILIVFKYWNFLAENLNFFIGSEKNESTIPLLHILLPIGLSFHTFQAMSYTIEVYRGRQKAEKHFGIYALYVMFYPQLVAGPIERPQNVLHQFHKKMNFSYANFKTGFILIFIGLFKKIFSADRLGSYVDSYYNNLDYLSFIPSASAAIFYSLQIYCDFSGYSSIAIGTAKCMGFNLMKNFNTPIKLLQLLIFGEDGISPCQHGSGTIYTSHWAATKEVNQPPSGIFRSYFYYQVFGTVQTGLSLFGVPYMHVCLFLNNFLSVKK